MKFLIFKNQNLREKAQYFKYKNHCGYDAKMVINFLKYFIRKYFTKNNQAKKTMYIRFSKLLYLTIYLIKNLKVMFFITYNAV